MVSAGMTSCFLWHSGQDQVCGLLSDSKEKLGGRWSWQDPSREAASEDRLSPPRGHPGRAPDSKGL